MKITFDYYEVLEAMQFMLKEKLERILKTEKVGFWGLQHFSANRGLLE